MFLMHLKKSIQIKGGSINAFDAEKYMGEGY